MSKQSLYTMAAFVCALIMDNPIKHYISQANLFESFFMSALTILVVTIFLSLGYALGDFFHKRIENKSKNEQIICNVLYAIILISSVFISYLLSR